MCEEKIYSCLECPPNNFCGIKNEYKTFNEMINHLINNHPFELEGKLKNILYEKIKKGD